MKLTPLQSVRMTVLLVALAAAHLPAMEKADQTTINLHTEILDPKVTWQDLDGDRRADIWVIDRHRRAEKNRMWAAFATDPHTVHELQFEPFPARIFPLVSEGRLAVSAYSQGVLWTYHPEKGWRVAHDFNQSEKMRPGIGLVPLGNQWLLPTGDGYLVLNGDCVSEELIAPPTVDISQKQMTLTYPIPQTTDFPNRLTARPIALSQAGEIRFWNATKEADGWQSNQHQLLFPNDLKPMRHQLGDLNGDNALDLAILAMPAKKMSLFGELTILIYLGDGEGGWERNASQQFKSKQNFWQTGPIEMDRHGLRLYYYKGIIRSIFRADTYRWNDAGYIEPKPVVTRWTLPDASRGFIKLDWDLNNDGKRDLLLRDEEGVHAFFRKDGDKPFDKDRRRTLAGRPTRDNMAGLEIAIESEFESRSAHNGLSSPISLTRFKPIYISDPQGNLWMWRLRRSEQGPWHLKGSRQ